MAMFTGSKSWAMHCARDEQMSMNSAEASRRIPSSESATHLGHEAISFLSGREDKAVSDMACICKVCGFSREISADFATWPNVLENVNIYPITSTGHSGSEVIGFICAKCLNSATEMRFQIKAMLSKVRVTDHAVIRFMERQEGDRVDKERARLALIRVFRQSQPIEIEKKFREERFRNNGSKPVIYRYCTGWIFVVTCDAPQTIVTIERAWNRQLGKNFWYVEPSDNPTQRNSSTPNSGKKNKNSAAPRRSDRSPEK